MNKTENPNNQSVSYNILNGIPLVLYLFPYSDGTSPPSLRADAHAIVFLPGALVTSISAFHPLVSLDKLIVMSLIPSKVHLHALW